MSEAVQETTLLQLQLDSIHQGLGATMTEQDGWSVPASYGDALAEYAAVRDSGAGLIDLSSRGRLLVTGSESLQFLNGLITNDMKTLAANQWMLAAFPNVQGRMLALVRVLNQSNDGSLAFLIDTEAATHQQVFKTVQRFTLAGDFRVEDLTDKTALLSLLGAGAASIIQNVFGEAAVNVQPFQVVQAPFQSSSATIVRSTHTCEHGFDLIVPAEIAREFWDALMNAGARAVGYEAFEILRVEAGIPRYGIDMDDTNVVSETGLDDAISFTKGCYIGQEIIARIKYRGHVAKRLTGVVFNGSVSVARGAKLTSVDDKEIGRITSSTDSPRLGRTIALAYVKYDYLAPGTKVKVDEVSGLVVELPFAL
ncbi:MAG TPA: aminomethyltransferase family protein [Pyrinomonadaceae bacterium]|nr:aminomethyltransferase family protein [Pyrinomonadaceae bacterium]